MVKVEAEPHVQQITLQRFPSVIPNSMIDINYMVPVQISTSASAHTVTMSAFATASQWEEELNKINLITSVGRVKVIKTGYEGGAEGFWFASNSTITLDIVFVSNYGMLESNLPIISVDSNVTCTTNGSVQLKLNVTNIVSQILSVPSLFSVGFNQTLSRIPRYTSPVPTDSTPAQFEQRLKELLSHGCVEDDRISEISDMYVTYETSSTTRTHPHAFCGFHSKNNPGVVRNRGYNLLSLPYVSCYTLGNQLCNRNCIHLARY